MISIPDYYELAAAINSFHRVLVVSSDLDPEEYHSLKLHLADCIEMLDRIDRT